MSSLLLTTLPICASLMKPLTDVVIKLLVFDDSGKRLGILSIFTEKQMRLTIDHRLDETESLWRVIPKNNKSRILKNKKNGLYIALSMDGQSLTVTASESDSLRFVFDEELNVYCFSLPNFVTKNLYPFFDNQSNKLIVVSDLSQKAQKTQTKVLPIFVSS